MKKPIEVNGIKIDERKANVIMRRILFLEKRNLVTKEKNTNALLRELANIIEEEVECS